MTPPPGEFEGVPAAAQSPLRCTRPWSPWPEVPRDTRQLLAHGRFFLEVFAGTAWLTQEVHRLDMAVLPPLDVELSDWVPVLGDVLDVHLWDHVMACAYAGVLFFVHFGTPCNTFSSARKLDNGPPPLRSAAAPMGLPSLSPDNAALVFLGNAFLHRSVELALVVFNHGGDFSIENPLLSLIWVTPPMQQLARLARTLDMDLDQCVFGAPSVKPTRIRVSSEFLCNLQQTCQGGHAHVRLKGKVWGPKRSKVVYRTKLAQEYPFALCATLALGVQQVWLQQLDHFQPSFELCTPASDRKRALGSGKMWAGHRQAATAQRALQAGYQLKRGAQKPLLEIELEPGQAIRWALEVVHPFSVPAEVDPGLAAAIDRLAADLPATVATRLEALRFWESEAHRLLPVSLARIAAQPDPDLRRLLRGGPDDEPALLGQVCHVALYEAMLQAVGSCDISLVEELLNGFAIVGTIGRSCRWPPYDKPQKVPPVEHALARAWAIRKKIITRVAAVPVSENLVKIWEATLEDCREGSCRGPWMSEHEISVFLGCQDWIPTQRFEVVQKNKVRGCDSATTNLINQVTEISEKLQLPSTDSNVAALRKLRSEFPSKKLGGWVLDERKAYRQVAIRPDQRKFSVICLKNPETDQPAFFVMVGHSFGLVSAVYNYNRRSAAINEILVKLFNLIAFSFYDDKYGFEPVDSVESARLAAECAHTWLGARYDQKKLQLSTTPTVLGVTYNLDEMQLEIKPDRRLDLLSEIQAILDADLLDPGTAGKLKGKLMFGASQLCAKIGRAFLRVISERQYMRIPLKSSFGLDSALKEALVQWKDLVDAGPPRTIDQQVSKKADVIIFTDGFTPDPRDKSQSRLPDRVGAVMFDRRLLRPKQFSEVIPKSVSEKWLQRTTQIIPIEMMAPVLALSSFADRLVNSDVILLIDSEAVEAALIKGYSSKSDVCLIISVFWKLALKLRCRIFIDRVSTDANPADWPSRNDLVRGQTAGWSTVQAVWPKSLSRAWGSDHDALSTG